MPRAALLIVLALVLAVGGCGSEEDQIEERVDQWLSGIAQGNGETGCEALDGPYRREVLGDLYEGSCEERVEQYWSDLTEEERDAFEETEITDIELQGETTGLARTKSPAPSEDFVSDAAFNMRKFDDGWKIESNNELEALE